MLSVEGLAVGAGNRGRGVVFASRAVSAARDRSSPPGSPLERPGALGVPSPGWARPYRAETALRALTVE